MDFKTLSKVADSTFGEGSEALRKRKADAARQSLKARLGRKLMDTEDTESVIEAAKEELATSDPEDVLQVTIEILDDVVENLQTQVEDARRKLADNIRRSKRRAIYPKRYDAQAKAAFRKKLMDTETTGEVIEAAKAELEQTDPVTVIETVVEVLDDVIENITTE